MSQNRIEVTNGEAVASVVPAQLEQWRKEGYWPLEDGVRDDSAETLIADDRDTVANEE